MKVKSRSEFLVPNRISDFRFQISDMKILASGFWLLPNSEFGIRDSEFLCPVSCVLPDPDARLLPCAVQGVIWAPTRHPEPRLGRPLQEPLAASCWRLAGFRSSGFRIRNSGFWPKAEGFISRRSRGDPSAVVSHQRPACLLMSRGRQSVRSRVFDSPAGAGLPA